MSQDDTSGDLPLNNGSDSTLRARSRLVRWWLAGGVVIVLSVAGGWVAARQVQTPDQAAANAAPPEPSWVTATVERRVLTQTVITRGDGVPEVSAVVGVPSSVEGDPVVTGIGVAMGDEVIEGQRLIEVSGRPVFVLIGEVPTYRSLRPGMSGADVAQLQGALTRLGCANPDPEGFFSEGTKACVDSFYASAGYAPVPSSPTETIDLTAANRAITGPTVARGEIVFVPSLPARVRSAVTVLGPVGASGSDPTQSAGSSSQLVELSAGDLIVTMRLRADERALVRAGTAVELLDEQTNVTYAATLSTVAETPTMGSDGQLGYRAEIVADEPLPAELAGVNLRVTIRAASTDTPTLVVPITAISSAADGTTSVSVLAPGATDPVLVGVNAGLSADGFVAIEPVEPNGLTAGDRVVVGR